MFGCCEEKASWLVVPLVKPTSCLQGRSRPWMWRGTCHQNETNTKSELAFLTIRRESWKHCGVKREKQTGMNACERSGWKPWKKNQRKNVKILCELLDLCIRKHWGTSESSRNFMGYLEEAVGIIGVMNFTCLCEAFLNVLIIWVSSSRIIHFQSCFSQSGEFKSDILSWRPFFFLKLTEVRL